MCRSMPTIPRLVICFTFLGLLTLDTKTYADYIDLALMEHAPKIIKKLRDVGLNNVGILKFQVVKPGQKATFNAGPINTTLAIRLRTALEMNDIYPRVGILPDCLDKARILAPTRGARGMAFLTDREAREFLLKQRYTGRKGEPIPAGAFLTGELVLAKNYRKANLVIREFDLKNASQPPAVFYTINDIPIDRTILSESGQSFSIRREIVKADEGDLLAEDEVDDPTQGGNVVMDPDLPIELNITYNGNPIKFEPDSSGSGNQFKVVDPKDKDEVVFSIKNISDRKIGVVLAVEGKNTLFEESLDMQRPADCTKWILDPNESVKIAGYYTDKEGSNLKKFRVLSDEESNAYLETINEVKGTFQVSVFREKSEEYSDRKLKALKSRLIPAKRGILGAEEVKSEGSKLTAVRFTHDPEPITSMNIRYYSPKSD